MVKRDIISEINKIAKVDADISIKGILTNEIKKLNYSNPTSLNYYFLTDLTNPQQKFWKSFAPHIKKSNELTRKLINGNKLQAKFSKWCRVLPDFVLEEGLVDGAIIGIPKVRGKVDFIIGDSILELKTKEEIPKDFKEVLEKYPNDLEQLVFYSALHPENPKNNFLIFMESKKPFNIIVFEVVTNDFNAVKNIIKKRIKLLDTALDSSMKDKGHKLLGKCRYHLGGCEFREHEICSCHKLQPLDTTELERAIDVKISYEFMKKLENSREEFEKATPVSIYINNIIAPRRQFMRSVLNIDSDFIDEFSEYKNCLYNAIRNSGFLNFDSKEKSDLLKKVFDERLKVPFEWLKIPSSSNPNGEMILPYISAVSKQDKFREAPAQYHIAQLGLTCASLGVDRGIIITIYPKVEKKLSVSIVSFNKEKLDSIKKLAKQVLDEIELAQSEADLKLLHQCPFYFDLNQDCEIRDKCKAINEYCN